MVLAFDRRELENHYMSATKTKERPALDTQASDAFLQKMFEDVMALFPTQTHRAAFARFFGRAC